MTADRKAASSFGGQPHDLSPQSTAGVQRLSGRRGGPARAAGSASPRRRRRRRPPRRRPGRPGPPGGGRDQRDGPAPDTNPAWPAVRSRAQQPGRVRRLGQALGLVRRSSVAGRSSSGRRPGPGEMAERAPVWAATANGTCSGSSRRASVAIGLGGDQGDGDQVGVDGHGPQRGRPSSTQARVAPPSRQGVALSGWPRARRPWRAARCRGGRGDQPAGRRPGRGPPRRRLTRTRVPGGSP